MKNEEGDAQEREQAILNEYEEKRYIHAPPLSA